MSPGKALLARVAALSDESTVVMTAGEIRGLFTGGAAAIKRRQRARARERGNCGVCTSKPADEGYTTCQACRARSAKSKRPPSGT